MIAVIEDELGALVAASAAHALGFPHDPHVLAAVSRALADRDDVPTIATLAALANMSPRTFERRLRRETGLTPRDWLRRARLGRATIALAVGASVTEAALDCGYASLGAFIAAYRRTFGVTPGRSDRHRSERHPLVSSDVACSNPAVLAPKTA